MPNISVNININPSNTNTIQRPLLFVEIGESNSGGEALNSDATTTELSSRPYIQILNNNTNIFENLHIGVNNNIGHVGLDSTTHSWELELCNQVAASVITNYTQVYLVQAGQGGSTIAQWLPTDPSGYYNTMLARVNTAKSFLTNPIIIVFYSQGINDIIAGTPAATWKTATENLYSNFRTAFGQTCPIIFPLFMTGRTDYNSTIIGMRSDVVQLFPTSTTGAALQNANHWSYAGFKTLTPFMTSQVQGLIY